MLPTDNLPNKPENPRSLAGWLRAAWEGSDEACAAELDAARPRGSGSTARATVSQWKGGHRVPSSRACGDIARVLRADPAEVRRRAAWARLWAARGDEADDARAAILAEVARLTGERDRALAERDVALALDSDEERLRARVEVALNKRLATRAARAEEVLAVEVHRLADARPTRAAEVVEALLAVVATACEGEDGGGAFADALLTFARVHDVPARAAVLGAFGAAASAAARAGQAVREAAGGGYSVMHPPESLPLGSIFPLATSTGREAAGGGYSVMRPLDTSTLREVTAMPEVRRLGGASTAIARRMMEALGIPEGERDRLLNQGGSVAFDGRGRVTARGDRRGTQLPLDEAGGGDHRATAVEFHWGEEEPPAADAVGGEPFLPGVLPDD